MSIDVKKIPLSIYIHLPWCLKKCPYCDFNSHALTGLLPEQLYIDTLIKDLQHDLALIKCKRPITSIFFGGGTPSLFSGKSLGRIIAVIQDYFKTDDSLEITLEVNPGSVEHDSFSSYQKAGVNRLSFGIQSFHSKHLQTLGRVHDSKQAYQAVHQAKKAGFDNINLDIMFALPQQTDSEALTDLTEAFSLQPKHISWYQLTIEPNTIFYRYPPKKLPNEHLLAKIEHAGKALLASHQFEQYEVSAYTQHGYECQHNLNYWQFGDYIGIGAGAHGKLTLPDGRIIRTQKTRHPKDYLARESDRTALTRPLSSADLPFEFMLNHLRLSQPIFFSLFEERTGLSPNSLIPTLATGKEKKLLDYDEKKLWLTDNAKYFVDDAIQLFLN